MKNKNDTIKITGMIIAGAVLLTLIVIAAVYNFQPRSTISVSGSGDVKVVPDMLDLNFRIQTKANTTANVNSANDNITDAVMEALIAEGFTKEEIQTSNFNIHEDYDWTGGEREMLGYIATHTLTIEMSTEEAEKISNAVNACVNQGATIDSLNYFLSEELEQKIRSEAIAKASQNAKEKAVDMTINLGSKLGRMVQITESYNNGYYPMYRAESLSMDSVAGNIQPQEQTQTASVSVLYAIR